MKSWDASLRIVPGVLGATAVMCAVFACSTRDGFRRDEPLFEPPPEGGTTEPPPPVCGVHCSRDLKEVLDGCEGAETVIARCNADQGCGEGRCVDACTAAVLSKGSTGCDFYTVYPDSPGPARGSCFAAMIANTWDRPVTISAELGASALDISKSTYLVQHDESGVSYTALQGPLAPAQVAIVFLSHDELRQSAMAVKCPAGVTPAVVLDPMRYGTARTSAFRIKTDAPVAAYSIAPYGGASSFEPTATLLLPVSSWANNYVAVAPFKFGDGAERLQSDRSLQIVAAEDGTEVSIRPTVDVEPGAGVAGALAGRSQTWTLARGEVLQFLQRSLAGSPIEATKPIAVFGGAECADIPREWGTCDMLQQQIPPFSSWGTEYAVVPFKSRVASLASSTAREQVPYSIVGAVDGTKLTYEPSRPRGAPETLDANQSANFITDEVFVVRSQDSKHPFHVSVYMTGASYGGGVPGNVTLGDPDYVNIAPTDQYLDRYVFFADHTYPETTLTVVRKKTARGFSPVELECGGEITGFEPLGSSEQYEYAWVQLTSGSKPQKLAKGECGYGRHEARSEGPFAITVWGIGAAASYGYVGGTGLRPIHDAPPPPVK